MNKSTTVDIIVLSRDWLDWRKVAAAQKLDESSLFEKLFSVFETIRRGKSYSIDSVKDGLVMDRMAVSSIHGQEVSRVKTKNGVKNYEKKTNREKLQLFRQQEVRVLKSYGCTYIWARWCSRSKCRPKSEAKNQKNHLPSEPSSASEIKLKIMSVFQSCQQCNTLNKNRLPQAVC